MFTRQTKKIANIPHIFIREAGLVSNGTLALYGTPDQNEEITADVSQIWIVDVAEEKTVFLAEIGNDFLTNDGQVLESMSNNFLVVNTGAALWRLDLLTDVDNPIGLSSLEGTSNNVDMPSVSPRATLTSLQILAPLLQTLNQLLLLGQLSVLTR